MNDFRFKKSLGQNFLFDKNIANKIMELSDIKKTDIILEIGPGDGFLTQFLVDNAKHVTVIEIDKNLYPMLEARFSGVKNFSLIKGDALKIDWKKIKPKPTKIIANIPYYITAPLIFKCIADLPNLESVIFMIQKEVADRLVAKPDSKSFGRLSITAQTVYNIQKGFNVSKNVFMPKPKIDSAVVIFERRKDIKIPVDDFDSFSNFLKRIFSKRRKMLMKILRQDFEISDDVLNDFWKSNNLEKKIRPENLSVDNWIKLFKFLKVK
ncbi:16S rRNA (adenine(1518)-N(6)/adenine(1519)-N(6))-dimethyltransferase RsmA [bacterium]